MGSAEECSADHRPGGCDDDDDRVAEYRIKRHGIQGVEEDEVRPGGGCRSARIGSRMHGRIRYGFPVHTPYVQFRCARSDDDRIVGRRGVRDVGDDSGTGPHSLCVAICTGGRRRCDRRFFPWTQT